MVKFIVGGTDPKAPRMIGIGLNKNDLNKFLTQGICISLSEILHSQIPDIRAQDELFLFQDETDEKILALLKERKWDMTNTIFRDFRGPNESS